MPSVSGREVPVRGVRCRGAALPGDDELGAVPAERDDVDAGADVE